MKPDLDSLKTEILDYLAKEGFVVFHGCSRRLEEIHCIEWDTQRYPDYRLFLAAARQAGAKMVVFHHREFTSGHIDHALDQLEEAETEPEDRRRIERSLRELGAYESFTCTIEISFEFGQRLYFFDLRSEWYQGYERLMDEIDVSIPEDGYDDEDDGSMGGYYSQN